MDSNLTNIILKDTYLKSLALKKTADLKDYFINQVFKTSKSQNTKPVDNHLRGLDPNDIKGINSDNVYDVFQKTTEELEKIEPLIVYLPAPLPEEEINKIGESLRKSYGDNFLMDIKYDPTLITGASLSYKGVYKDYSVKKKIEDQKEAILSIFKRYIRH
jgi:F0F1-type ATP synthase delta subunit